jgi:hypothetical protein
MGGVVGGGGEKGPGWQRGGREEGLELGEASGELRRLSLEKVERESGCESPFAARP